MQAIKLSFGEAPLVNMRGEMGAGQTTPRHRKVAAAPPRGVGPRPTRRVLLAMDYYIISVHQGVVDYARRSGWILDSRPIQMRQLPVDLRADGALTLIGSPELFGPKLRATGIPMVNMSPWGEEFGIPSVQLDNERAGALAASHLLGRGLTDLTMVQFHPGSLTSSARCRGFADTVTAAGRRFHRLVVGGVPHVARGEVPVSWQGFQRQLLALPKPLGLFTEGDLAAVDVIHFCQQIGLRIPDDVAVVGVDNDPLVVTVAPIPVTSVDNNLHGLGVRAAELLDDILDGKPPPTRPIVIAPRGVVGRRSTDVIAVANEDVAAALAFIHARFREPIKASDASRQSSTSRRRLQDLFLAQVGRTLSEEITHRRLDLAKQLLRESGLKTSLIAQRCGLGTATQLCKVFARELQMTPREYRQRFTTSNGADDAG